MNDCAFEYTETQNLEDFRDVHDIREPGLVSEQQTEQPLEEQLPADLSSGVEFVKQPTSVGVDGSTNDSGDDARVANKCPPKKQWNIPSGEWRCRRRSALEDNSTWSLVQLPEGHANLLLGEFWDAILVTLF
ncbi:hypothetical protein LIER_18645 [Lithospermum erythrorhizon]|uniref:Uncharacterized protein n=1 Tax=Lithospermum erythrorhizon TaxID=34254 RepID=A0AAV3QGF1_LITER